MKHRKICILASGAAAGAVNGLFGAGGGIIAVEVLKKSGLSQKAAHSNAVAVCLPISVLSAVLYILNDRVKFGDAAPYIIWGLIGAVIGTVILKKISPNVLKKIFAVFIIYAGARLLLR